MRYKIFSQITNLMKMNWRINILTLLSLITHHYLFLDRNILSSGDWVYYFKESSNSLGNYLLYLQSYGFGIVMPLPNNFPFYIISKLFFDLNLNWDIFTRIIFLFPIIFFTPIFSYLCFSSILKNSNAAFISTLVYIFNTFFLKLQLDWITYASIWWILPLCFLLIKEWYTTKKIYILPILALVLSISIILEIRIAINIFIFISLQSLIYSTFYPEINRRLKYFIAVMLTITIGVLIHSFWILPVKFGGLFDSLVEYADNKPFLSFYHLSDVLTLHSYQWANNLVYEPFINQKIDPQLYIIPLLAFLGIYSSLKSKNICKEDKILVLITLVIFTFLSKQEQPPLPNLYRWMYNHIPLFNLYRESSKFIVMVAFTLSIL